MCDFDRLRANLESVIEGDSLDFKSSAHSFAIDVTRVCKFLIPYLIPPLEPIIINQFEVEGNTFPVVLTWITSNCAWSNFNSKTNPLISDETPNELPRFI
jgi:hypothetical protein